MTFDQIKERLGMDSEKTAKLRNSISSDLKRLGGSEQKINEAIKKVPKEKLAAVSTLIENAKDSAARELLGIDQLDRNAKHDFLSKVSALIGRPLENNNLIAKQSRERGELDNGVAAAKGGYFQRFKNID